MVLSHLPLDVVGSTEGRKVSYRDHCMEPGWAGQLLSAFLFAQWCGHKIQAPIDVIILF